MGGAVYHEQRAHITGCHATYVHVKSSHCFLVCTLQAMLLPRSLVGAHAFWRFDPNVSAGDANFVARYTVSATLCPGKLCMRGTIDVTISMMWLSAICYLLSAGEVSNILALALPTDYVTPHAPNAAPLGPCHADRTEVQRHTRRRLPS